MFPIHEIELPLGKPTSYCDRYNPQLLVAIPREQQRATLAMPTLLPFRGVDIWHAYEISWLNGKGKPQVAIGQFLIPCTSPYLIESKSLKLYLNSLNGTSFASTQEVIQTIQDDLGSAVGSSVQVTLQNLESYGPEYLGNFTGTFLDELDITCEHYQVTPELLTVNGHELITETVYSHLLKSNCLITGQPDWASIAITYTGYPISHEGLLQYLISYREHREFHEQCVERIFLDIYRYCQPQALTVYACYTRRGGLDICPFRSTTLDFPITIQRLYRQ